MRTAIPGSDVVLLKSCAEDLDVVNAAKVSLAQIAKEWEGKSHSGLINFLMKNKHGTPFEHNYFKFHVKLPIFVAREWHRHRIGHSYNEMSGRYVELPEEFYVPLRIRSQEGKPGAYTFVEQSVGRKTRSVRKAIFSSEKRAFKLYKKLLKKGVAKEQARIVLPVGTYTQMIWSCNARSLMAFLELRNSEHAMKEIRDLARDTEEYFKIKMPATWQAFQNNGRVAP